MFADSLFLDSFNRGTAPTVKHGAQKQKCLKKRDFFKLVWRTDDIQLSVIQMNIQLSVKHMNIQLNVKEKTWEFLLDRLMLG